jgi:hypothetical protein
MAFVGSALVVAVSVVLVVVLVLPGGAPRKAAEKKQVTTTTTVPAQATTFLGPDGVESTAIVAENERQGTTAWMISGNQGSGFIEGFASTTYAAAGQQVNFYVSTSAPSYQVVAYRMGWYHGEGARQVWSSALLPGVVQPACPVTPVTNMVACDNWSLSLTVTITSDFFPGDYLFKLTGSGNQQSYVLLVVWDQTSKATYLMVSRSLTMQGWNTFGGYDYYQGKGPCPAGSGSYPPCNRARVVSFDRPYADGNGASDFIGDEFPLVEFAEEHGLDVTYCTDITVNDHPSILLQHKALLSLGHDETWTYPELEGTETAASQGVNIAFLGAAAIVRHARLQASPLGPDQEEVDYRDSTEDPLNGVGSSTEVTGNTWASPPTDIQTQGLVGEIYAGYTDPGAPTLPFEVEDASAWIFKGTGLDNGSVIPDVVSSDIDHIDPSSLMPSDLEVLGHSPLPLKYVYTGQGTWGSDTYSDMTYYTEPTSAAGIFDSGDVNWIDTLTPCTTGQSQCPAPLTQQITGNLLWLFGQGPAGYIQPSVANWQSVTPKGS